MRPNNSSDKDRQALLEKFVDSVGLDTILEDLADICRLKANHIESNWQDKDLANEWDLAANNIDDARKASFAG